jgi:hypothetical protein
MKSCSILENLKKKICLHNSQYQGFSRKKKQTTTQFKMQKEKKKQRKEKLHANENLEADSNRTWANQSSDSKTKAWSKASDRSNKQNQNCRFINQYQSFSFWPGIVQLMSEII